MKKSSELNAIELMFWGFFILIACFFNNHFLRYNILYKALYYNDISWHNQKIITITCHLSNTMKLIYSDTVLICSIFGNLHLQFFEH